MEKNGVISLLVIIGMLVGATITANYQTEKAKKIIERQALRIQYLEGVNSIRYTVITDTTILKQRIEERHPTPPLQPEDRY